MNCKKAFYFSLFLLVPGILPAQNVSETRSYMRSVPVTKETTLEISNKYGNIHLTSWNRDSVSVKTEIEAFAPNQDRIRKMFDGIKINMTETSYLVRIQTVFEQNINMLFESFKGITGKYINYDSRVQINYFITVPEYLNLRIENRYGDVYMESCRGNFSATISNGTFRAGSLGNDARLTLNFCNATINSLGSGKIDASFSEITLTESGTLRINSLSSRFDLLETESINVESRRDKFFISNISSVSGNSYFTDYRIENLSGGIDLNARYGNLNVGMINPRFETINITSSFSDVTLVFDNDASYSMEIKHLNAFVVLPDRNVKSDKEVLNEEKREYITYATIGRNPGNRKAKIYATRGNIYIK